MNQRPSTDPDRAITAGFPPFCQTAQEPVVLGQAEAYLKRPISKRNVPPALWNHLVCAQQQIVERMVMSLWREQIAPVTCTHRGSFHIELSIAPAIAVRMEVERLLGFGRGSRILGVSLCRSGQLPVPLHCPLELLDLLSTALGTRFGYERLARFRAEIESSVLHLTVALAAAEHRSQKIARTGIISLDAWQQSFPDDDARRRSLEGAVVLGHPLHPCTKTRFGFSANDSLRYAPEHAREPAELRFVALHASIAQCAGTPLGQIWEQLWPRQVQDARRALGTAAVDADAYHVVPIHPWQHEHRLQLLFPDLLESRAIIELPMRAAFWPQLSLRTVEPAIAGGARYHIKLALHVQTTSAERTISPQTVANGPRITAILEQLCAERAIPLRVIGERASVGLAPDAIRDGLDRARQIAAIVRDNPSFLPGSPGAVSRDWLAAALVSTSVFSPRAWITEWIRDYRRGSTEAAAAERLFRAYCRSLLQPTLTLLLCHGIALEAHGQNTMIDFDREGLPCGIAIRDFGGVRIHRETLARSGVELDLCEGSATAAQSFDEAVSKFSHCVLQSHLLDLIAAIDRDLPGALPDPWSIVHEQIIAVARSVHAAPEPLAAIYRATVPAKCLLSMRLQGLYNRYTYADVDNPLARYAEARK